MEKSRDAFRTIGEVSEWLSTPTHVLRFWETRFPQVKPLKRAGGRRYYRPSDMALLGGIKKLLHDDGLTIRGVQKLLREQGVKHVAGLSVLSPGDAPIGDGVMADVEGPTPQTDVDADAVPRPEETAAAAVKTVAAVEPETVARAEPDLIEGHAPEAPMAVDVPEERDERQADIVALPTQPRLPLDLPEAPRPRKSLPVATTIAARIRQMSRAELEPHAQSLAVVQHMLTDLRERMAEAAGSGRA